MNPYCLPGFILHDELALLVESGITPRAALQMAVLNPAKFWGKNGRARSVEADKDADLVLLDARPLFEIPKQDPHSSRMAGHAIRLHLIRRILPTVLHVRIRGLGAKVEITIGYVGYSGTTWVPAFVTLIYWLVLQLIGQHQVDTRHGPPGGIAYSAHIGGFFSGFLLVRLIPGHTRYRYGGWMNKDSENAQNQQIGKNN